MVFLVNNFAPVGDALAEVDCWRLDIVEQEIKQAKFPVKWPVNLLFNCRKHHPGETVYTGTIQEISLAGMKISTDHNVCSKREIEMQVVIPPLWQGDGEHAVLLTGRTRFTALASGKFLTEVDFVLFKGDGYQVLAHHLEHRFG